MIGRLELLSVKKGEDTILFILMSFHELSLKIALCGYLLFNTYGHITHKLRNRIIEYLLPYMELKYTS